MSKQIKKVQHKKQAHGNQCFPKPDMRLDTFMGKCILFLKEKNFFQMDNSEMIDTLTKDFRSKLLKSDKMKSG